VRTTGGLLRLGLWSQGQGSGIDGIVIVERLGGGEGLRRLGAFYPWAVEELA
jgi:hypothetical protein